MDLMLWTEPQRRINISVTDWLALGKIAVTLIFCVSSWMILRRIVHMCIDHIERCLCIPTTTIIFCVVLSQIFILLDRYDMPCKSVQRRLYLKKNTPLVNMHENVFGVFLYEERPQAFLCIFAPDWFFFAKKFHSTYLYPHVLS